MHRKIGGPRPSLPQCIILLCFATAVTAHNIPHSSGQRAHQNGHSQQGNDALQALHQPLQAATLQDTGAVSQREDTQPALAHADHRSTDTIQPRTVSLYSTRGTVDAVVSGSSNRNQGRRSVGLSFQDQRRLQQEVELHSKGKGDNSWRKDRDVNEEQMEEDILAAAASKSDKARECIMCLDSSLSAGQAACYT